MTDLRAQADLIESASRRIATASDVEMCERDGMPIQRSAFADAFEVIFRKDEMFSLAQIPADASAECIEDGVATAVGALVRHVENLHANRYEPQIGGLTEKALRAERANWLAKREGRRPPYTARQIRRRMRTWVVAIDDVAGTVETEVRP